MTGTLGRVPTQTRRPESHGITVFGCEQDEADLFTQLGPRFGVLPTTTSATVSASSLLAAAGNRCISVGHKSDISEPLLLALRDAGVEHISTRSIGFDHIDLHAAARAGITVDNAVYAPDGVADYTLMLILMAIRNARTTITSVEHHDFRLPVVRGEDLRDLTVGVVGVGNIGTAVVQRLQGFGCRVLTSDHVSLDNLLRESDVVTLHAPLNPATHHLIGRRAITTMKRGAYLVNTGRGALVDTDALVVALEAERLAGAALDVLEGEEGLFYVDCTDRPIDHGLLLRLQRLPNVIITPHTAYYTRRALHDTVEQTLIQCREFESRRTRG